MKQPQQGCHLNVYDTSRAVQPHAHVLLHTDLSSARMVWLWCELYSSMRLQHSINKWHARCAGFTLRTKYKGHANRNTQIRATFSADGAFLLCGSDDGWVYVWPASAGPDDDAAALAQVLAASCRALAMLPLTASAGSTDAFPACCMDPAGQSCLAVSALLPAPWAHEVHMSCAAGPAVRRRGAGLLCSLHSRMLTLDAWFLIWRAGEERLVRVLPRAQRHRHRRALRARDGAAPEQAPLRGPPAAQGAPPPPCAATSCPAQLSRRMHASRGADGGMSSWVFAA
jgi:hypothetical protein